MVVVRAESDAESWISNMIPLYSQAKSVRIVVSAPDPKAYVNMVTYVPFPSINVIKSADVVIPTVGYPSVKNNKIFSPSVHGAPYSSLEAADNMEKALLMAAS